MEQVSVKMDIDLNRITRHAKNIMLLSLISLITLPLYLIALLYFLFYLNKLKKLKSNQSLSSEYTRLKGKKTKQLRSIKWHSDSLEKSLAGFFLAHRTTVTILIVVGVTIAIMIGIISMYYLLGWEVV